MRLSGTGSPKGVDSLAQTAPKEFNAGPSQQLKSTLEHHRHSAAKQVTASPDTTPWPGTYRRRTTQKKRAITGTHTERLRKAGTPGLFTRLGESRAQDAHDGLRSKLDGCKTLITAFN